MILAASRPDINPLTIVKTRDGDDGSIFITCHKSRVIDQVRNRSVPVRMRDFTTQQTMALKHAWFEVNPPELKITGDSYVYLQIEYDVNFGVDNTTPIGIASVEVIHRTLSDRIEPEEFFQQRRCYLLVAEIYFEEESHSIDENGQLVPIPGIAVNQIISSTPSLYVIPRNVSEDSENDGFNLPDPPPDSVRLIKDIEFSFTETNGFEARITYADLTVTRTGDGGININETAYTAQNQIGRRLAMPQVTTFSGT